MKDRPAKEYTSCFIDFRVDQDDVYVGILPDGTEETISHDTWDEWGMRILLRYEIDQIEKPK